MSLGAGCAWLPESPGLVCVVRHRPLHDCAPPCRNAGHCGRGRCRIGTHRRSRRLAVRFDFGSGWCIARRSPDADSDIIDARHLRADWHIAWRRRDTGDIARHGNVSGQHCGADPGHGPHFYWWCRISASHSSLGQCRRVPCCGSRRHVAGAGAGCRARRRSARDCDRAEHPRSRHCRRTARRTVHAGACRPGTAKSDRCSEHRCSRRVGDPRGGFDRCRNHRLSHPLSGRIALRRHAHVSSAAWERPDSRCHALVGGEYGDGRDGGYYWLTFRQYAAAHAVELCRGCLRFLCCCRDDCCRVCGSPDQRTVAACRRSDDCLRARLGRRHDAAGARDSISIRFMWAPTI